MGSRSFDKNANNSLIVMHIPTRLPCKVHRMYNSTKTFTKVTPKKV